MDNSKGVDLLDTSNAFRIDGDQAIIKRTQEIDKNFLSNLSDDRFESSNSRMGEFHKVASIPTVIVEKWMAEGFNIYDKNVNIAEIVRRLQSEDMTGLMATTKRLF